MRIDNTVQNFYRNVLNKKTNEVSGKQPFDYAFTPSKPSGLAAKKVEMPLDIQAEGFKAAAESLGARSKINNFTNDFEKLFGVGINGENKFNMNSLGENKLTDDQIKDFQSRYDVTNLSPQDKYNLMTELTQLGVISGKDAVNSTLSVMAMPTVNGVPMMVTQGNGILNDSTNFLSNLQNVSAQEMKSYSYMEESFGKIFDDVKNISESHNRLLDVLEQLKQEK